jgi:hypothetical protein
MFFKTALFIFFYYLILISTLGYGLLFSNFLKIRNQVFSFSISGILGVIFLTFLSYTTNIFFAHNYIHNTIVHIVGLIFFFIFFKKNFSKYIFYKPLILLSIFFLLSLFLSKNNEDFPYYHLAFTINLVESNTIIGIGNFNPAYRTASSLFYYHSLMYLPYIKYYLFHSSGVIILTFASFFFINNFYLIKTYHKNKFIKILCALIFTFVVLTFSRIAEYGTDRAGQIIVFMLIITILQIINKKEIDLDKSKSAILLILYVITVKAYFIVYSLFLLIVFIKFKISEILKLIKNNYFFFLLTLFFMLMYFLSNLLNSGCLVYPLIFTCFENLSWTAPLENIIQNSQWFELWAKAGATPNYIVDDRENYIKFLNWFPNWISNYFFTKGSDFILIILSISLIFFLFFKNLSERKINEVPKYKYKYVYFILILLFIIWFNKHPDLRYGGYAIVTLLFFVPVSIFLSKFNIKKKKIVNFYAYIILFVLIVFNLKNILRIHSEFNRTDRYQFKDFPFFYIEKVEFTQFKINETTIVNFPINNFCWSVSFPCVEEYNKLQVEDFFIFKKFLKKNIQ